MFTVSFYYVFAIAFIAHYIVNYGGSNSKISYPTVSIICVIPAIITSSLFIYFEYFDCENTNINILDIVNVLLAHALILMAVCSILILLELKQQKEKRQKMVSNNFFKEGEESVHQASNIMYHFILLFMAVTVVVWTPYVMYGLAVVFSHTILPSINLNHWSFQILYTLQQILIPSIGIFHALAIHFGLRRKGERVQIPIDFMTTQLDSVKSKSKLQPKPKPKQANPKRSVYNDIEQFYGIGYKPKEKVEIMDKDIIQSIQIEENIIPSNEISPPPNIHRILRLSSKPSRIQSKYLSPSDSDSDDEFGDPIETNFLQLPQ
ncbi:hypothetical protein HDV01_002694 [Terramyces sp. JEL0728]|nr:hypothetical protein HDV01_002694 [Terramyces sp. JEL0728]